MKKKLLVNPIGMLFLVISLILVMQYAVMIFPMFSIYVLPDFLTKVGYVKHNIPYVETKIHNNETITNDVLFDEFKRILGNYDCELLRRVEVFNNGEKEYYTFHDKNKEIGSGKVLFIQVSGGFGVDFKNYADIKAMMDIWLFITENQLSDKVEGIAYWFNKLGEASAYTEIHISKDQFLEFYNLSTVKDMPKKEKIEELTELWVEKVNYIRPPGSVDVINMTNP